MLKIYIIEKKSQVFFLKTGSIDNRGAIRVPCTVSGITFFAPQFSEIGRQGEALWGQDKTKE